MSRAITSQFRSELAAGLCRPRFFLEMHLLSQVLRLWTGSQDVTFAGEVWSASSLFKSIDQISVQKGSPEGMRVNLAGEPSEMMSLVQSGFIANKVGRLYLGFVNDALALIPDPLMLFQGRLDNVALADDVDEATVTVTYENDVASIYTENEYRYTHECQQIFAPGDLGLEYMSQMEDLQLYWGVPESKKGRKKKPDGKKPKKPSRRGGKKR
jgi:hypothetical protein